MTDNDFSTVETSVALDPDKRQYLQYLAIGHYIMAGLAFLFGSIPLFHIAFGVLMATQGVGFGGPKDQALVGVTFGLFLAFIGLILVVSAWTYGIFMIKAARALTEQRHHTLCMVMAAISCMFAPVGTALGIFTLLLLLDDEVKAAFRR